MTPGKHGDMSVFTEGTHGDPQTKLLWTIDDEGAHFVKEEMPWDSSRNMPSHTNISDNAYFAGEAWRTGPNEITINSGSRGFGYNRQVAQKLEGADLEAYNSAMQARYDRSVEYFKSLGFDVKQVPLGQR